MTKIGVFTLLGFALIAVLFLAWQRWTSPAHTVDYEGRIVDRWADQSGEAQNYQPVLALEVESNDGHRFTVKVDPNVYESARIGMRIKSKGGQIVLIDSEEKPVAK